MPRHNEKWYLMLTVIRHMALHKLFCCACFIVILCASCNSRTIDLTNNSKDKAESDDISYEIDNLNPTISQPLDAKYGDLAGYKFVQIEVIKVFNPQKYPLTFEVRFQSKSNEKTYLGSFSLYPADNPGKFLVATQGKLKDGGAIILSLVVPDKLAAKDTIKVTVKKIKLIKG